jgi:hypothetical protein
LYHRYERSPEMFEDSVCVYCHRAIYRERDGAWNLTYLEYAGTRTCDARSDGANVSTLPHEPREATR